MSERIRDVFKRGIPLGELVDANQGLSTGDNDQFLRRWWEVSQDKVGYGMAGRDEAAQSGKKWFPCNKGGPFRKWYGNHEYLINWENDGREIRAFGTEDGGRPRSGVSNTAFYFQEALTWSDVTSGPTSFRLNDHGSIHESKGHCAFAGAFRSLLAAYCNTPIVRLIVSTINPTLSFKVGNFRTIPFLEDAGAELASTVTPSVHRLTRITRRDWNAYERSWEFQSFPVLAVTSLTLEPLVYASHISTLKSAFTAWTQHNRSTIAEVQRLEEENNRLFIDAYRLTEELSPAVPQEQVTLTINPAYRYRGKLTEDEGWARFREDTMAELVSYAIGCMMGRYSLDEPGLIYAQSEGQGYDANRYRAFPADEDGIVPITDEEWFEDDAAGRIEKFLSTVCNPDHLEQNLTFLAQSLSPRRSESSRDTLRRYLKTRFYKDHVQTYKKRPIYWLFTSGPRKALQCLVYLHRYKDSTLARMRTEYVLPLLGRMAAKEERLVGDIAAPTSTHHRAKLEKERETLMKLLAELRDFDNRLRHYANLRVRLNLDDGVKVNYGRFGDLLADVKSITK